MSELATATGYFQRLGEAIERDWCRASYDEHRLADIASIHLRATPAHAACSPWQLLHELSAPRAVVNQQQNFGQPPVTVYRAPRFYIELLFWQESTTAIHQHGFCGAFTLLQGSSVHSTYTFATHQRINDHLSLGQLSARNSELLAPGDIRPIHPGQQFIHALFHLDHPSVTIVVRTYTMNQGQGPQFTYLKPGVAVDPFLKRATTRKQLEILALLLQLERADARTFAFGMLQHQPDFHTLFSVLDAVWKHARTMEHPLFIELLAAGRAVHGDLVAYIVAALAEQDIRTRIVAHRTRVRDPELRFFLALLLNVPTGPAIHRLVATRYPERGPTTNIIAGWLAQLADVQALDLDEFDEIRAGMLDAMVRGASFEDIVQGLADEYGAEEVDSQRDDLRAIHEQLRTMPTTRALFTTDTV